MDLHNNRILRNTILLFTSALAMPGQSPPPGAGVFVARDIPLSGRTGTPGTVEAAQSVASTGESATLIRGSASVRGAFSGSVLALMRMHAGPVKASLRSAAPIQKMLDDQAQLWSSVDVFRYLAMRCGVCIPVVFLLRKAHSQAAAQG